MKKVKILSVPKEKVYGMVNSGALKVSETYVTKNGYQGYLFIRRDIEKMLINIP